jgi:hypothetical protein
MIYIINEISATIAAALPNGRLEELDMSSCAVGTFGLTTLCNTLKQNNSLKTINLRQNNINIQSKIAFQEVCNINIHTGT